MNINTYFDEMGKIQNKILEYLDSTPRKEDEYANLKDIFEKNKIHDKKHELKSVLYLLSKISNNHHRCPCFFEKITEILVYFKDDMKKYFSNSEIFNIFQSNKRILLILFDEKIIDIDKYIAGQINNKYAEYFKPEIQLFKDKKAEKQLVNFYENRKIGENESSICNLIRKDSIDGFISYLNTNNCSIKTIIELSHFETNQFLIKNRGTTLIEYAAFFGSIQIFKYLKLNGAQLKPNLWLYAIHGRNAEIIHILEEECNVDEKDESHENWFKESIKCHHNDMANYILNNYLSDEKEKSKDSIINGLKYYNFSLLKDELINESLLGYLCKYDYYEIVDILLKEKQIDINLQLILLLKFNSIFIDVYNFIKFESICFNGI